MPDPLCACLACRGLSVRACRACSGALLGQFSDHGRDTIVAFDMYSCYTCIALGLLTAVAALPAFGAARHMFYREAASGLNRRAPAHMSWLGSYLTCPDAHRMILGC